jgi:hypothetical protein
MTMKYGHAFFFVLATAALFVHPARADDELNLGLKEAPPIILALAKEWFQRCRSGHIDRTQLDVRVNHELTGEMVRKFSEKLKPFGKPLKFVYFGSNKFQYAIGYNFVIEFENGRVIELIAFDPDGKIAGIDFQTFVRDGSSGKLTQD